MEEDEKEIEDNPENKLWHIIKHCRVIELNGIDAANAFLSSKKSYNGYKLLPNDIIKLGRVRFKVREIVSPAYVKKQNKALKKLRMMKNKNFNESSRDNGEHIQYGVTDEAYF